MCYRALVNVDWGNLGPELKSDRLYNFAKIKRKLEKYEEAVSLFQQSLEIEERISGKTSAKTGRRLAELALTYAEQKRYKEGFPFVQRLSPIAEQYTGSERVTVGFIHYHYSDWLRSNDQVDLANNFAEKAKSLGFIPRR
jgi:tetratricopeptide (TPR) repeat protein